jgi:hypothetical protein
MVEEVAQEIINENSLQHSFGLCERGHDTSLWAEPLNTISNMAFIVVAIMIARYYRHHQDLKGKWIWDIHAMTALTFLIGICSTLFHTYPNFYTELADLIPIVSLIVLFFISAIFRIGKCSLFDGIIAFIAFIGFTNIMVGLFPRAFNDSVGYVSTMGSLVVIALYLHMKRRASSHSFLLASVVGLVSLFFRSIDNETCQEIPIGTHFLWHTLNAILIYILMKQIIRNVNREARLNRIAIHNAVNGHNKKP